MDVELKDTQNQQWKEDKSGFGFRMLQKMGWKEDKGLGKNESGIVNNVKITKREVGLGLGMEETIDGAGNKAWSETANSFNDVLAVLKASYSNDNTKGKKKKSKIKKSASMPIISVGMKYKRIREAKDLSTKSDAEKHAIFGMSCSSSSCSSSSSGNMAVDLVSNSASSASTNDLMSIGNREDKAISDASSVPGTIAIDSGAFSVIKHSESAPNNLLATRPSEMEMSKKAKKKSKKKASK